MAEADDAERQHLLRDDGAQGGQSRWSAARARVRAAVLIKNASLDIRAGFVRKVYGILCVQMILTALVAYPIMCLGPEKIKGLQWMLILSMLFMVASMCAMMCCQDVMRKFPNNYILLGLFTVATGIMVGFASAMYTWQSVFLALIITIGIFICMTIYAFTTKTDFTGMGPYLAAFCFALIVFGLTLSIMMYCGVQNIKWAYMAYNFMGVLLFTMYLVYDTQLLMGGDHKIALGVDDYCLAALALYLDIVNLFLHILRLVGERR